MARKGSNDGRLLATLKSITAFVKRATAWTNALALLIRALIDLLK